MIRRKPWFRTLATLLAVWLPLVAGEPGVLQPCPMHGAARAVIATLRGRPVEPGMVGGTMASGRTPSHQHHAASTATSSGADHSAPASSHDHHNCSCIDGCSAASVVAFVVPDQPVAQFAVAYETTRSVPSVESLARPGPEFSRPYTTGPPRA